MKPLIIKETVTADRRKEIYELGKTTKFETPTIYILKPASNTLSIHGSDDLSKYIYTDKIPTDCEVMRVDSCINSGVVFTDKNTILVRIFGTPYDIITTRQKFQTLMIKTFLDEGMVINLSSHKPYSNDFTFSKGDKEKKFCGCVTDLEQMYFSFFITLKFDGKKVDGLYKLDTDKFQNRGNVSNITDVVGGIKEINPKVNDSIVDKLIDNLSSELGWI